MATIHRPLLEGAVRALKNIFIEGRHADKVIEYELKANKKWGSRDRRVFAETVYDINRWCRRILFGLNRDMTDPQPWPWEEIIQAYLEHGFLEPNEGMSPAVKHSLPDWLYDYGLSQLPDRWEREMSALNQPAPAFLRVNRLVTEPSKVVAELKSEEIEAESQPGLPDALRLSERKNVFRTKSFQAGHFEMQDGGSQQIAPWLAPEPGECVIDACAGAGGKTLHLAALMRNKGRLIALDVHERKLAELKTRAARNGVSNLVIKHIDSTKVIKRLHGMADRLLLDVPCSGSGVWRRNPDGRWKLSAPELERLRELQREILRSYSAMVRSGGRMVYSTCSIFPDENDRQIDWFLATPAGSNWRVLERHHIWPSETPYDGFFGAVLERT